jgi:hypothetical protein
LRRTSPHDRRAHASGIDDCLPRFRRRALVDIPAKLEADLSM